MLGHWKERAAGSWEPPCLVPQLKAGNFSERCASLWARFRSNEAETLRPALREVRAGWPDGLADSRFYVFVLLEPGRLLCALQNAAPPRAQVSWAEHAVG